MIEKQKVDTVFYLSLVFDELIPLIMFTKYTHATFLHQEAEYLQISRGR